MPSSGTRSIRARQIYTSCRALSAVAKPLSHGTCHAFSPSQKASQHSVLQTTLPQTPQLHQYQQTRPQQPLKSSTEMTTPTAIRPPTPRPLSKLGSGFLSSSRSPLRPFSSRSPSSPLSTPITSGCTGVCFCGADHRAPAASPRDHRGPGPGRPYPPVATGHPPCGGLGPLLPHLLAHGGEPSV